MAAVREIGVDVGGQAPLGDKLHAVNIPAGRSYRIRHLGSYDAMQPAIDYLYAAAIEAGETLSERPPLFHYLDDPEEVAEENLRCDVYLVVS